MYKNECLSVCVCVLVFVLYQVLKYSFYLQSEDFFGSKEGLLGPMMIRFKGWGRIGFRLGLE